MADQTSGFALAAVLGGVVFLYAGIRGVSVLKSIQAVIQGKAPSTVAQSQPIAATSGVLVASTSAAGSAGGAVSGSGATRYQGHCYLYGGAPGLTGAGCWDCSSFVNWYIGHDLGRPIPGVAHYDGSSHGPATGSWLIWSGAVTIPASQAQDGDIVVWPTHMGIYLGGGQMISALNPSLGTRVTSVAGGAPGGEGSGTYRRLT